jgi:hypothetical protein
MDSPRACIFLLVASVACGGRAAAPKAPAVSAATVTVRGVAHDAKGGAIVQTDEGEVYYVAGLDSWPADLRGVRVEVTGRPAHRKLIPDPVVSDSGEHSAGAFGDQDVLEAATWRRTDP